MRFGIGKSFDAGLRRGFFGHLLQLAPELGDGVDGAMLEERVHLGLHGGGCEAKMLRGVVRGGGVRHGAEEPRIVSVDEFEVREHVLVRVGMTRREEVALVAAENGFAVRRSFRRDSRFDLLLRSFHHRNSLSIAVDVHFFLAFHLHVLMS